MATLQGDRSLELDEQQENTQYEPVPEISGPVLARLMQPNPWRWLRDLAIEWGIIAGAVALAGYWNHWVGYALAVLLVGTRLHALGVLGHEGAHKRITRVRWLNDWMAQIFCFSALCADMNGYRRFHFPHHRFTNTPKDPEMEYRKLGRPDWDLPCPRRRIARRFVLDLLGFGILEPVRMMYVCKPQGWKGWLVALGPASAVALLLAWLGHFWVFALYLAAFATSFSAVWKFRCFIEHLGTLDTHRVHLPLWLAWLVAPHYIWVHWEHHHWPAIPYFNLTQARRLAGKIPVISLGELFRQYESSAPIRSGTPTLDDQGNPVAWS